MQGKKGTINITAAEIEAALASGQSLTDFGREKNIKHVSAYALRQGIRVQERTRLAQEEEALRLVRQYGQIALGLHDTKFSDDAIYRAKRRLEQRYGKEWWAAQGSPQGTKGEE
jgi:hypothetical protein